MNAIEWKSFTLTHVIYPKGDLFGKLLAISSLLPHALVVSFFTLTVFVRDIHVISFFVGLVLDELFNFVLKKFHADGRPEQIIGQPNTNDTFGWPSNHSQFMGFFCTYSTLMITFRLRQTRSKAFCLFLIIANILSLIVVFYSRIYLLYHFVYQCVHGVLFGFAFAVFWFLFIIFFVEPYIFPFLLRSKLNLDFLHLCSIYVPPRSSKRSTKNDKKSSKSR